MRETQNCSNYHLGAGFSLNHCQRYPISRRICFLHKTSRTLNIQDCSWTLTLHMSKKDNNSSRQQSPTSGHASVCMQQTFKNYRIGSILILRSPALLCFQALPWTQHHEQHWPGDSLGRSEAPGPLAWAADPGSQKKTWVWSWGNAEQ